RNGLSLDRRGREIVLVFERACDWIGEAEVLKGGQKGVLSIIKAGAWRSQPGAGEVSETPACLGRRFWLAEGASQKPLDGLRTRGSQGPDDSQGHGPHMEHERGAFKVIRQANAWRG